MTIVWRYYDTSIFTSRRDSPKQLGFSVTLGFFEIPYFQEFYLSRPIIFSKNPLKNHQKKIRWAAPRTPSLRACAKGMVARRPGMQQKGYLDCTSS